jgi:G3E family GTPase
MGLFLEPAGDRLPVSLLTGFLGSGKTTLLNRLLAQEAMANTAVLVNEFGDVPLDRDLIEKKDDDVLVMPNGCLCCSVQDDFEGVMGSLFARRGRGVTAFERLVIETTGLADPTSIVQLLLASPLIVQNFALDSVIATADAVHALRQVEENPEAATQLAVADRIVVTKTDIARDVAALEARLAALNPTARVLRAVHGDIDARELFGAGPGSGWLERVPADSDAGHKSGGIASFSLVCERPLEWHAFNRWLTGVKVKHGEKLLRVKGIVNAGGEPVAVHGVHHVFHPPVKLAGFGGDTRTRLVFITRGDLKAEIGRTWLEKIILDSEENER